MNMHVKEKIPKHPVFSFQVCKGDRDAEIPSLLEAGEVRYVNRGSMAIALALKHMGLSKGEEVLVPAYHCTAMVDPVLWSGASPVFYRIGKDLAPNFEDIEMRLTSACRVMIVPHYFGFHQDMAKIRSFCDRHRLLLIEDCAHAFFGRHDNHPVGYYGDYAIGSAWKFFPVNEGACLISSKRNLNDISTISGGFLFEVKSLVNTLEYAVEYGRLGVLNPIVRGIFKLKDRIWSGLKGTPELQGIQSVEARGGATGFDGRRVRQSNSFMSRWIIDRASRSRIVRKRRENYARLLSSLANLPGCHPLFDVLPEEVVPHVFPLVMDEPEKCFPLLKEAGVPIIRFGEFLWDGMEKGLCIVSEEYSRKVFQFPCHQDLNLDELTWMIEKIKEIVLQAPTNFED